MKNQTQWIFDCPLHGPESSVLCWRAFNTEHARNWYKYEVFYVAVGFDESERSKMVAKLRASLEPVPNLL